MSDTIGRARTIVVTKSLPHFKELTIPWKRHSGTVIPGIMRFLLNGIKAHAVKVSALGG